MGAYIAESDKYPERLVKSAGKTQYNYDVKEVARSDDIDGGKDHIVYTYKYVVIDGKVTKKKVLDALADAESSEEIEDIEAIEAERIKDKEYVAKITDQTYADIDKKDYSNVEDLKEVHKAMLAILRLNDNEQKTVSDIKIIDDSINR